MTEFTVRYIKSIEKYIYCRLYIILAEQWNHFTKSKRKW